MPTYTISGINIGSFNLGEADKILTIFSAERGIVRAVAKGARKPGSKISGKAEVLNVNKLMLATGRNLDIITQAESLETFSGLRTDFNRLAYGLYYAELTQAFGQGLSEESNEYFELLREALNAQSKTVDEPARLCLNFEIALLDLLGYKPELTYCVICRQIINDMNLALFDREHGGIVCRNCEAENKRPQVRESTLYENRVLLNESAQITPLVWKHLILASSRTSTQSFGTGALPSPSQAQSLFAAHRLMQGYIEHRAGKRMKALDLVGAISNR